MDPTTLPPYLTVREAADLLRCHPKTLQRWRKDPEHGLPWSDRTGQVLYPRDDVLAFLAPSHR